MRESARVRAREYECARTRECARERKHRRERKRDKGRERDRQTDRQRERERERERERKDRERERERERSAVPIGSDREYNAKERNIRHRCRERKKVLGFMRRSAASSDVVSNVHVYI